MEVGGSSGSIIVAEGGRERSRRSRGGKDADRWGWNDNDDNDAGPV